MLTQEMSEPVVKEEMFEQAPDFKHEINNVLKHEVCTCSEDVKECKTELLDPELEGKFLKEECCELHNIPVNLQ